MTPAMITAALIAAALPAGPARAQSAPAAATSATAAPLEEIVVVGSHARTHTKTTTTVPVDVFSGTELKRALAGGEVGQALQDLSPSINLPRESASGTSDSIRVIQVRGLPPDETLVLVDGKRRHTTAVPDTEGIFQGTVPVDINAIPTAMIDHIEFLRDGAGAEYGSDAIAGVVNIVLNHEPTGGSASIGYGSNDTYFDPLHKRIVDGQTGTASFTDGIALGQGGYLRFGADGAASAGNNRAGASNAYWTSYYDTPADLALNNKVLFKSGEPSYQKGDLFYNGAIPLENGWEAYSNASFDFRHTEGAAFFRFPGDPTNDTNIYPNGYRPITNTNGVDIGFVGGIRYTLADPWTWDFSARQGDNEVRYGVQNSLNASLGDASPTHFHLADFIFRQTALNADATRDVDISFLPAPVSLAMGAEYDHEIYQTGAGDPASYAAGPVTTDSQGNVDVPPGAQAGPGLRPQDVANLSRDIGALYLEGETRLIPAWTLNIAGRFTDYSEVGPSGTGKISTRYALTDDFSVRGSVSNSFRAPALAQEGFRFATLNFNATGTGLQNDLVVPATDPLARALGALPLKPETSNNFSLGAAWKLPYDTVLTVDGYYIEVDHRIILSSNLYLPDALQAANPSVQSVSFLTNAVDSTNKGLDIELEHSQDVAGGLLRSSLALNLNNIRLDRVRTGADGAQILNPPDLLRARAGTPASKLIITNSYTHDQLSAMLRVTRYGSMYNQSFEPTAPLESGTPAQYFGPKIVVDLQASYQLSASWAFTLGANNLLDVYPTRTINTNNATYGGALPYDPIDPVGISGAYYYSRLTYKF